MLGVESSESGRVPWVRLEAIIGCITQLVRSSGKNFGNNEGVGVLGAGAPRLAACGLRHGSSGGPVRPIFINSRLKTLARGQASQGGRHKTSSGTASPGRLTRRRRDQGRVPREVLVTQAMTIETRRVPACAVSLFPLWCNGGKHRRGVLRH